MTERTTQSGPERAAIRGWLEARHQRSLPGIAWLIASQIAVLLAIMTFYSWFRKTYFQRSAEIAYQHALDVIALQERLGLSVHAVELRMQQWVLERPPLIDFFNIYYRQFKPGLYLAAGLCLLLAPAGFRRVRRVFLLATLIAFPWYALYPLSPPRFMTGFGFPFVDTVAIFRGVPSSAEGPAGANQFAAMPSMHIGWTLVAALWLAAALPWRRIGLYLGLIHVTIMCVTVMVTANHYWIDIVAGFAVTGSAWLIARSLPERLPGSDWFSRRPFLPPPPAGERVRAR